MNFGTGNRQHVEENFRRAGADGRRGVRRDLTGLGRLIEEAEHRQLLRDDPRARGRRAGLVVRREAIIRVDLDVVHLHDMDRHLRGFERRRRVAVVEVRHFLAARRRFHFALERNFLLKLPALSVQARRLTPRPTRLRLMLEVRRTAPRSQLYFHFLGSFFCVRQDGLAGG